MALQALTDAAVAERIAVLAAWQRRGKTIERRLRFADFRAAIAFVNRLADLAEERDHHPDIAIHYREVTLTLWTHVVDGLTERDFALAEAIDRLVPGAGS